MVEPGFAPDISCAATVCEGTIAEYSTSADCETYEWTVTGGNLISGQGTPTITVEWTTPPLGSISLSAECGEEYCSMPTIVAIPIIGSSADIQGQTFFCANDVLQYNAPYFGGTQYVWTINPPTAGTILTGQNTNLIAIQWNDAPATLTLSYHNTLLNCGGVGALIVTPKPSFAINPIAPVCEGSTTTVSANSLLPFVWSVSGGEVVSGQNTNTVTILWNVPGTANISILPVNPDDFCNATAQTTATVVPYPQTPAISGAETVCPLQTYIYTASSEQVNTQFVWTVEGGTITAGQNSPTVSVQWNEAPPYLLSVVRQTMTGTVCTSEPAALSPTPLADSPFTVTGNATACPGSLQTYQITPALTGATYTWTVSPPDAALIAQGQGTGQVSVLFGNMPATSLTLSAAYCNLTAELVINIGVLPQPGILQADTLCTGSSIVLSAADLGGGPPYTGYLWKNASNTTISNLPTATINGEGVYSLQVTNESGCTGFTTHRVYQYTSPVAKILTAVNTNICIQFPPEIELYAIDGTNYAFEWTVDDVPVSGSNSPFLTHSGSGIVGNYPYQVLVTDTSNTCSVWSNLVTIHQVDCSGGIAPPDTVIVPPPPPMNCPPVAGFNIDFTLSTTGTDCNTVTLNATTSGDFTGFSVHWGEGSLQPFDGISETHTYSSLQVNIYKITLIGYFIHPVTGQPCFRTLMKTHEVPLAARFDIEPACLSSAWKFQDRSYYLPTTGITQWLWDFGDGTPPLDGTQTEMHTFTNSGTYTATLTISDGNCTVSSSNNYTVAALPNAQFTVSGGECAGNAQNFVPDENSLAAYFWQFGDGNTSGLSNPVYTYAAPGDYAVSLQTLNQQGCYSALQTQSITVAGAPEPQPVTASDTLFCAGLNATLTAPDGGVSYLWSSGQTTPSIIVSTSGNYSVQVTLPSGCVYTSPSVNIQVIPAPSATLSPASPVNICLGSSVTLQAPANENHTYVWSQNDNGLPYNTFINNGIQTVTVTDTITGCTASGSVEIIVHNNPSVPSITASATQLCEGQTADISVTAPSPQNTYLWTTGAAGTAITVNTTGTYGVYAVNSNGCVSDTSFLANINFVALPNAAAFPAGCYAICPGEPITLPQNTAETYQWYFNGLPLDGATGNSIVPQAEGAYWVVMTNSPNCTVTTEVLQLEFSDCTGPLPVSLVSFTGTIQPDGNLLKWTTASELNSAFFTLQFSADGNTFEDLTRLNAAGNSSSARHYESLHGQPYPLAYYRLMQTDFDGSTRQTGNVITLLRPQTTGSFALTHITPTPTQHMATLTYTTPNTQPITLHLYDLTGRLLQHETSGCEKTCFFAKTLIKTGYRIIPKAYTFDWSGDVFEVTTFVQNEKEC
ncbi:MAG: PKD domain-containing protein [Sphingobacteriales bacterium]|nr:MAG: PKD domain-containing protein [Sphingobacteriales bacterium]